MADKTVLNTEWLKQFIHGDFDDFRTALRKMLHDDPSGRSLEFIADGDLSPSALVAAKPLAIGYMATAPKASDAGSGDASQSGTTQPSMLTYGGTTIPQTGGGKLNRDIQRAASEIYQLLTEHNTLFNDVEQALLETIDKMKDTQTKNLDKVSTDTFMDIFEDVDRDLTSAGSGGTATGTDDDGGNDSGSDTGS
ncbi:type VII secretion system-associated protein [Streptomyces sp. NA02950]|uniref:type VII secretion system-associated protein n=1 Tax=Streptomyces sp. NA02950 TaxID=2742137 RepID=UPI0015912125|nr:type VII secretion system-associated protein [Streptomyces sp. NA02950]QKV96024.1 type VII secretion system-associated protein [Streptomyces sp. NA02950]